MSTALIPSRSKAVAELYQRLVDILGGGLNGAGDIDSLPGLLGELSRLTDDQLRSAPEHDIVIMWWLAAILGHTHGLEERLLNSNVTSRFADLSRYFSGRLVSKSQAVLDLISQAARERDTTLLADIADHISQGWAGYSESVFPKAIANLAATFPNGTLTLHQTANTSYVLWQRGLAAAKAGEFSAAAEDFEAATAIYKRLDYIADAAWLYVDRVICMLGLGRREDAEKLRDEQVQYVNGIIADWPSGEQDALWHFDDWSGQYSTFVESRYLGEQPLSQRDGDVLNNYVQASDHLILAATQTEPEFLAAIDLFSFGWRSFDQSHYPEIFSRLADALGMREIEINTSYRTWLDLLEIPRVHPTAEHYFDLAEQLERRLVRAGLEHDASVVILDAAVISYVMYGRAAALQWLEPRRYRSEQLTNSLFAAATNAIQIPIGSNNEMVLSAYLAERCTITRPAFTDAIISLAEFQRNTTSRNLSLRLTGTRLSVCGVTVYDTVPSAIGGPVEILINEFNEARAQSIAPKALSSAELADRLNSSQGAVTQAMHRLREVLRKRFTKALALPLDDGAVVQGRPGYRLNPVFVESAMSSFS